MRMTATIASLCLFLAQAAAVPVGAPLPPAFGAGARATAAQNHPAAAQPISPRFLPWPPAAPDSAPSGASPLPPSADASDPYAFAVTLEQVLAAVQREMNRLRQWLESLRQAAADALTQIVVPLPMEMPAGAGPVDIVTHIAALPDRWRAIVAAALAKLHTPDSAGGAAARHKTDISASPELSHEAGTIASADQQVISSVLQQELAIAATAAVAEGATEDAALPAALDAARTTADQLIAGAQDIPSSRAGIELLVAGTGAGLRSQASLTVALARRITGLIQQAAQLSGQVGALTSAIGVLAERDLERDRAALDARLGIADAARGGGTLLRQLLEGAGEPADEIHLTPLY